MNSVCGVWCSVVASAAGLATPPGGFWMGLAFGDFDVDGFADIVVMTAPWEVRDPATGAVVAANPDGRPVLLRNEGNDNRSVTSSLVGTDSNQSGIGARVELQSGHVTQVREVRAGSSMASTDSPWPSFGMGKRRFARANVEWPSGHCERYILRAGAVRTLTEGAGLRCRGWWHW